jgi:nicotinate-nucleotide pyrophosphorylase (carboxylating)
MFLPRKIVEEKLRQFLAEDAGEGDVTTSLLIPAGATAEAIVVARETGVIAGVEEAQILLESLGINAETALNDGSTAKKGQTIIKIRGDARTILTVERTLLNLVSRMSGIASATRNLVNLLQKNRINARVACTRKTAPGLLYFDKKAVEIGGGDTHRFHLDDMILIKDNHLALANSMEEAMRKAKENASFSKKIEVEITKSEDVLSAIKAGADIVMLDNFSPRQIRKTIELMKRNGCYKKVLLEASGGITSRNFIDFASTGVDILSLGELTQSSKALNVSLEILTKKKTR